MDVYVTLTEAAKMLDISRWSLYRRVDEGALTTYVSQTNHRVKLVKRADVEALLEPQPVNRKSAETTEARGR